RRGPAPTVTPAGWQDGGTSPGPSLSDTGDFVAVYRLQYPRLVAALRLSGVAPVVAQDLAQEAFARAFGHWWRVRKGPNPAGYVYTIAFRLLRRGGGLPETPLDDHEPVVLGPEDEAVTGVTVHHALAAMPPRRRACAVLCFYLGLTAEQAGGVLRIEASTVRVQLHHARTTLRRVLAETGTGASRQRRRLIP
ncbi:MAG: RNA polymerase sigma factor, partial [Actinomycetota bacterium]|nr:RNA polymerase sigma factor [Actinomycetota bacterium]